MPLRSDGYENSWGRSLLSFFEAGTECVGLLRDCWSEQEDALGLLGWRQKWLRALNFEVISQVCLDHGRSGLDLAAILHSLLFLCVDACRSFVVMCDVRHAYIILRVLFKVGHDGRYEFSQFIVS